MRSVSYGCLCLSEDMNEPFPEYKSEALSLQCLSLVCLTCCGERASHIRYRSLLPDMEREMTY